MIECMGEVWCGVVWDGMVWSKVVPGIYGGWIFGPEIDM